MIEPRRCPSVKSGLTEKRVTVCRQPGKEFLVKIRPLSRWIRDGKMTGPR